MKKIYIYIFAFLFSMPVLAENLPWADYKTFHFGFTLGTNFMDFGIKESMLVQDGTVYQADISTITPGFTVGVIGDLRLNNYFNLRTIPALYLGDRKLSYVDASNTQVFNTSIRSTMLYVPFYLKYNAVRINEYRPYLLAGGGFIIDMGRDKAKPILLRTADYFAEFGFGWSVYFEYFKFSPEIRFSMGLSNILTKWEDRNNDIDPNYQQYTEAISGLTNRIVTICFNFE